MFHFSTPIKLTCDSEDVMGFRMEHIILNFARGWDKAQAAVSLRHCAELAERSVQSKRVKGQGRKSSGRAKFEIQIKRM